MEPAVLALSAALSTVGLCFLQQQSLYSAGQRVWAEWAIWGVIALSCWLQNYKSRRRINVVYDKESQSISTSSKPCLEKPAMVLSLLLVASVCISSRIHDHQVQWAYVSYIHKPPPPPPQYLAKDNSLSRRSSPSLNYTSMAAGALRTPIEVEMLRPFGIHGRSLHLILCPKGHRPSSWWAYASPLS